MRKKFESGSKYITKKKKEPSKFITKKNIGANDYRQGGMVLNSVDNRKNKK